MIAHATDHLPTPHRIALETVCDRLHGLRLAWAVSGSTALRLHGADVIPDDIDLLFTARGAHIAESQLARELDERVTHRSRVGVRGVLGRARIAGVVVELLGDVQNALPGGDWSAPPEIEGNRVWLAIDGRACPVLSLAALEHGYALQQRPERVRLIERLQLERS